MKYLVRGAASLIVALVLFYCAYSEYDSSKSANTTLYPEKEYIKPDSLQ